ncbi:MAG: Mur ligase family CapB protein, partial [Haloarculaceae archaeon]
GRTASFAEYVDLLYEQGHVDSAHVGGANTRAFAENTELPVTRHDKGNDAETVLTDLLAEGKPVVIMGNTVDEFMREFEEAVSTQEQGTNESIKPK